MLRKVILLLDSYLIVVLSPEPLLSIWKSGFRVMNIVRFTLGIIVFVATMFVMFILYIAPLHSDMMLYCSLLNPGDDVLVVCGYIMVVIIYGISEIIVLLLCCLFCCQITNFVWSARCGHIFILLSICTVLVQLVHFLPKLLCKLLEAKLLVYAGIQDSICKGKPHYYIDTTQRHYPRERGRFLRFFSGHLSRGLLASLLLPDDHDDNGIEVGGDLPDVEEIPGNHCICTYVMRLQPQDAFYSFVVYFCERREDEAFYEVCSAFDIPENIREKIATNNSSMVIRCFDALHRVYHRDNELTLTTVKTKLSEYNDELKQIVSDYDMNE